MICAVVGCSKRSDRDKDVSFYRIPTIRTGRGKRELELTTKRRTGYVAAISRGGLCESALNQARICSRHFISGKPASLYDDLNPDWLPTQNLGHSKCSKRALVSSERYERKRARFARAQISAAGVSPVNDWGNAEDHAENGNCHVEIQTGETPEEITRLRSELNLAYETISALKDNIERLLPFTAASLQGPSDQYLIHYTGLPNFKILQTIFDLVAPENSPGTTKLAPFQEFMLVLLKLRLNASSQDLACRFDVHPSTVSRILLK